MHSNTIQETARLSIPAHFFFYQNDSKEQVPFPLESYSNLSHLFSNLPTKIQHSQNISENIGMYLLAQKANFISKCDRSTIRDSNPVSEFNSSRDLTGEGSRGVCPPESGFLHSASCPAGPSLPQQVSESLSF